MDNNKRNLKRIVYTSSYDRGLEHLLNMWPDIRKEVPDAQLHVYYGWQLFKDFYKDNPASMKWMENMNTLMAQAGITNHGRVSQPDLKKEMEKSGIWAYPTHFGEINCISALKAQAYGCEPVVVNYAALKETVQFGRKVEGDIYDQETKDAFKKELIDALRHPMGEVERDRMMHTMSDVKWENVAEKWTEVLKNG